MIGTGRRSRPEPEQPMAVKPASPSEGASTSRVDTRIIGETRRSFSVVCSSYGLEGGRYTAEHPLDAGKKAGRMLMMKASQLNLKPARDTREVFFELKELTASKKVARLKQRYFYRLTRKSIPLAERKVQKFASANGSTVTVTVEDTYEVVAISEDYLVSNMPRPLLRNDEPECPRTPDARAPKKYRQHRVSSE